MIKYTPVFMESPEIPKSIATEPISLGINSPKVELGVGSMLNNSLTYTPVESNLQSARETLSARTISTPTVKQTTKSLIRFAGEEKDVGKMNEFINKAESLGIGFKITSGYRKEAVTSSGNRSRHADGLAIDIVPLDGESFDDLINKFKNSPELKQYMVDNNIGFLTEITKEEQEKYGATGANIHISIPGGTRNYGEKNAINSRRRVLGV